MIQATWVRTTQVIELEHAVICTGTNQDDAPVVYMITKTHPALRDMQLAIAKHGYSVNFIPDSNVGTGILTVAPINQEVYQ